ncbi:MAG: Gx transporter family protein [Eubacterium sp.]|nr:Gx transporter family protein [Eubacterium sp.]
MENSKAKKAAFFGIMVALAFTFSYFESLIPFNIGIPGVKLGLANLVVVIALYFYGIKAAFPIALIRILLAGFTFGNVNSLLYSLAGGILSLLVMWAVKNTKLSVIGVSILGGVTHNIGQLAAAALLMNTARIIYYLPVLLVAGTVTGFLIGTAAKLTLDKLDKINKKPSD